jgi:hypothetical protein
MALTHPTTPCLNFQSRLSETQGETLETFNETTAPSLLIDFPSFVCSDLAWSAAQFKIEEQYVYSGLSKACTLLTIPLKIPLLT